MANAFTLLLGLALGVWQTRRLRRATVQLLDQSRPSPWLLAAAFAGRLLLPVLVLVLVLVRSPVAALAMLGGYWLGRTVVLARELFQIRAGS